MNVLVLLLLMLSTSGFASQLISTGEVEELFKKAFNQNLTEAESVKLNKLIEILHRPEVVSSRALDASSPIRATLDCIICRSVFAAAFDVVGQGQDLSTVTQTVAFFCSVLGIESESVCDGVAKLNMPIFTYIIRNAPEANPAAYCAIVLQNSASDACPSGDTRFEWQVELPPQSDTIPNETTSQEPLTIAIITDVHIDPLYEANGVADCGEPTCCRKGQTHARNTLYKTALNDDDIEKFVKKIDGEVFLDLSGEPELKALKQARRQQYLRDSSPAGYWGDFRNCDTPIWAFDDAIDRITETHKNIDVVYYMGDSIDHFVWETTYEGINDVNRYVIDKLRKNFGDDVLVVPTIGNHESQPTNQFAPSTITEEGLNTTWLYEGLANKWDFYLTEEAKETLRKQGDFSVLVRPGLRAISLNTNVAYRNNWWLVYDPTDAKKHLDWLIEELYKAEQAGEKVHILTHIPPGVHDLTYTWTREYNRIVNRFSSTIAAEFNGHLHSDEFKIFYDESDRPINMAWGAGSLTTYSFYNHNYKIATFNTSTYEPENFVTYVYNMTEANLTPHRRPHWFNLYDMKNTFGLSDLSAASMDELTRRMVTTHKPLLQIYSAFLPKMSESKWQWCNTNDDCLLNNLCRAVTTVLWQRQKCNQLRDLYFT